MGLADRRPRFPEFSICPHSTLNHNSIRSQVAVSASHLWEVVWCRQCGVKKIVDTSLKLPLVSVYPWKEDAPIAVLWLDQFGSGT